MRRFAVILAIVAVVAAATAAGQDSRGAGLLAGSSPAPSPGACPTRTAATPAASPTAPSQPVITIGAVAIEMTDQGFIPANFESAVGQDVRVTLHNRGGRPHAFTIERLHIDVLVPPGQTRTVTIPSPPLGEYRYVSDAPCDDTSGMAGTMVIFI
ncbi:MAG TPA: cupredoxin domain-containing protein [Thermomicrobiales bacterium]|nr:cupredoxin domain-containing protein [Thermomicrobiales bacterium]